MGQDFLDKQYTNSMYRMSSVSNLLCVFFHDEIQIQIQVRFFSVLDIIFFLDLIRIKVINIRNKNNYLIPVQPNSVLSWRRATLYRALFHLTLNDVNFTICLYIKHSHEFTIKTNKRTICFPTFSCSLCHGGVQGIAVISSKG